MGFQFLFRPVASIVAAALLSSISVAARAQCLGDCADDRAVSIDELLIGVNLALGRPGLESCPAFDGNDDQAVAVDELVAAVRNALQGCPETPTETPLPTATFTPAPDDTPTVTPTPAVGPVIGFRGLTLADNSLLDPVGETDAGVPIYAPRFGSGFVLVIEAGPGLSREEVGLFTFDGPGTPDLQVVVSRPLGNGSATICDNTPPNAGGVPAIDPPHFDESPPVRAALNDLGCRFTDGVGEHIGRGCLNEACVRAESGQFGCVSGDSEIQFCGYVDAPMAFPEGDTLVSARVRDREGNYGPVAQMIVRVEP